jgi:O-antigen ligase
MVLLTVVNMVGALLSKSPEKSAESAVTFLLEGFLLYFILANVVRTKERLRVCLLVLLAAGAVMSAVPLYQQVTGDYENDYGGMGIVSGGRGFRTGEDSHDGEVRQKRLTGPIGEQNRYAQILLVLVPIGAFGFRGVSSQRLRRLAVAGAIVTAAGATVAFSRGGAVGFAAMLMVGFGMRYLGRRELIAMVLAGFVILIAAPQYVARLLTLDAALQVMVEGKGAAGQIDDGAITGRATEMGAAFLVFLDHPILGVGPGMFRYYSADYGEKIGLRQLEGARQAHSLIPDIAAEHGIAGLLCYFFVIGLTLRELHLVRMRWLKDDPELAHLATGLLLAIVSYLCVGMFMHRAYIRYFWIVMGLSAAVRSIALNQDATET